MLIPEGVTLKVEKIPIKLLYLDPSQGLSLKHALTLASALLKSDMIWFPPLGCIKDGDRYRVKEGHHRYVAYLSLGYDKALVCYYEDDIVGGGKK